MKRVFVITTYKKLLTLLALLIAAGVPALILAVNIQHWQHMQVSAPAESEGIQELTRENGHFRDMLETILPKENRILYENPYRLYGDCKANIETVPLRDVADKGKPLQFSVLYKVPEYLRPIYDPGWAATYYRGWIDLEYKVEEARHRLYTFPLGASAAYDFMGSLGFEGSPRVDAHRNINFLIYHFDVEGVKQLGNQIALVGRPQRTGVQVVALNKDHLFPENAGAGDFLIQLSTPGGYEIDFVYEMNVMKYEYLMEEIKEHSVRPKPAFSTAAEMSLESLVRENKLLRNELSRYIPIEEKATITEKECRPWPGAINLGNTSTLEAAYENGREMEWVIHYKNSEYRRPLYHPEWGNNAAAGWSYIPGKICENLHTFFSLPSDAGKQSDLLGRLGFTEKYKTVPKNREGFLIYSFNVQKVIKYNSQIVITGVPGRMGAEVISFEIEPYIKGKRYLVQTATPDLNEIDYEIIAIN